MPTQALSRAVEPVVTIICDEPDGAVERCVYPMQLSIENLKRFWELSRKYKTLFSHETRDDFTKFANLLLKVGPNGIEPTGLFWVVDDFVGVFYLTDITPGVDAKVHYTFLDGRHRGRVELAQAMLRFAFEKYNFRRLSAEVPLYATESAFHLMRLVGFKKEGRKRRSSFFDEKWFDVTLYGILKEEALNEL